MSSQLPFLLRRGCGGEDVGGAGELSHRGLSLKEFGLKLGGFVIGVVGVVANELLLFFDLSRGGLQLKLTSMWF